jgi:hypothetical protein
MNHLFGYCIIQIHGAIPFATVTRNQAFYIPTLAAAEFLVGTHPPVRQDLRQRALQLCQNRFRALVSSFTGIITGHSEVLYSYQVS